MTHTATTATLSFNLVVDGPVTQVWEAQAGLYVLQVTLSLGAWTWAVLAEGGYYVATGRAASWEEARAHAVAWLIR